MADAGVSYAGRPDLGPGVSFTLPIYGTAAAADASGRVAFDPEEFTGEVVEVRNWRVWPVEGDSMAPVALDGQRVAFSEEPPRSGGLALVNVKRRGVLFKRYYPHGETVTLASINPTPAPDYAPITVKAADIRWAFRVVAVILDE